VIGLLASLQAPDHWRWIPFGGACERRKDIGRADLQPLSVFLDGGVVPRADRAEDNHNRLGADLDKYLAVRPGDIVFNKLRTWQGGFGHARNEGIVSPAYFVCRPHDAEPRYLDYALHSQPYLQELTRISKWMPPSQFDIAWGDLKRLPLLLPPAVQQRRIADFLDAETARIDALIDTKQQMHAVLFDTRREVTFTGVAGLVTAGHDRRGSSLPWVADLPSNWGEAKLTLLARLGSGHTPSRSRPEWWVDRTIPWITTGEVSQMRTDRIETISETREQISDLGVANSSAEVHPAGTVVLCRTASAGYSAIMAEPMATSQDFATWTCGERLLPQFLLLCLRAMRSDLLGRLAMGSTHKTIYMPDIESIRIPVPPMKEQQQVVDAVWQRLGRIDAIVDTLTQQIDLLRERRSALITAVVSGELVV